MASFYVHFLVRYSIPVWLVVGLVSCQSDTSARRTEEKIIARVGTENLYLTDVQENIPSRSSAADSVAFLKRYANAWVRRQLLLQRAQAESEVAQEEIDRKVQEYRYYLLTQAFEKQYVEKNLDSTVTEAEIKTYYQKNPESFALQEPIVRARLVAVPKNSPSLEQLRTWLTAPSARNTKELQSYCYRFARFYHLADSVWLSVDELTRKTPFYTPGERTKFVKNAGFTETSDEENVYLLAVKEYKTSGQPAPLSYVQAQVRELIINRRKVELIQKLEQKMYEEAEKSKQVEIAVQ